MKTKNLGLQLLSSRSPNAVTHNANLGLIEQALSQARNFFHATFNHADTGTYGPAVAVSDIPAIFKSCNWTGTDGTFWPNPPTQVNTELRARIAYSGGADPYARDYFANGIPARTVTMMDAEGWSDSNTKLAVDWWRAKNSAPFFLSGRDIDVGDNRDAIGAGGNTARQNIVDDLYAMWPFASVVPYFGIGCYMLGTTVVSRDLDYFDVIIQMIRQVYPNKPIIAVGWGAFHDGFNPPHTLITGSNLTRYVDFLCSKVSGAVLWGPRQDNIDIMRAIDNV
jgi:hypothetical protein